MNELDSRIREIHIFDLDDTLVDSAAAVVSAYREAAERLGCMLPPDFYGCSAEEWQCTVELHSMKSALYLEKYAAQVQHGWAAAAFRSCKQLDHVRTEVWTAASLQSVLALRQQTHLADVTCPDEWHVRQTVRDKVMRMEELYSNYTVPREVLLHYYDDNAEHSARITSKYLVGVQLHAKETLAI